MGNDIYIGIFNGADNTPGHLFLVLVHAGMHSSDDEIEFGEKLVGYIEASIGTDVYLVAGEDMDAVDPLVKLLNLLYLLLQSLRIQAVSDTSSRRVVGNTQVLVAKVFSRQCHGLNAITPITPVGMHMEVALNISRLYQLG